MIEDLELLQLFKAESAEHLANLDDGLLRLEKNPKDPPLLEELFRESHSLKGAARMLGLSKIENVTHSLERILSEARKGDTSLTPDAIERMNGILSHLRQLVQAAISDEPSVEINELEPTIAPSPVEKDVVTTVELIASLPPVGSPVIPLSEEEIPLVEPIPLAPSVQRVLPAKTATDEILEPVISGGDAFHIDTVRVETRKLDDLLNLVSELNVIEGRIQHRLLLMDAVSEQWAMLERSRKKFRTLLRGIDINTKIDDALHAEDKLLAQFGERFKAARDDFYEDSTRLEVTINTLEEQVHAVRLLPLSTLFTLFPRMVRDLAKQQNKDVELIIDGGDIRVDKRILEEMKDPLMHLLRNAIDHGIEPAAERELLGKTRRSTVLLQARRENNNVLLEICDDGRGLDIASIKHTALKRGVHDEATLAAMPLAQIQQLIFLPGFSTSHFITELSGHGVGLDVVRVNVERMKGSIHLESTTGQRLSVQLRLPVSLAATRLLLASVGEQLYGLPVDLVHTSLRVREADIFILEGRPAVLLNGRPVIAARLVDLLELPITERTASSDTAVCIVIQVDDRQLGLLVDDLLSVEEVVPKPLGAPLRRVRNVSALAMLGSGEICVVLNPADLLRSAYKSNPMPRQSSEHKTQLKTDNAAVLLVEDSALIRAMEKRILEDGGYEVIAAVDGLEALNLLGSRSFSAVVTDIMMPNMDGLTLTQHIRAEPRYKDLPVILVTTLSSDEDKRRGLDVGANAYLPKPSFDQRTLLDTLKRLILT